jgi:hypothetical protein
MSHSQRYVRSEVVFPNAILAQLDAAVSFGSAACVAVDSEIAAPPADNKHAASKDTSPAVGTKTLSEADSGIVCANAPTVRAGLV